jgi:hypothetical protein
LKRRHNLPQTDLAPVNSIIEKEQVAAVQKEETVRKASME